MVDKKINQVKYFQNELLKEGFKTTTGHEINVNYEPEKDYLSIITPYSPQPIKIFGNNLTKFIETLLNIQNQRGN